MSVNAPLVLPLYLSVAFLFGAVNAHTSSLEWGLRMRHVIYVTAHRGAFLLD